MYVSKENSFQLVHIWKLKNTQSQSTSAALDRDPARLASFPADWMSQLYDREAGEVQGLYMPLRYAGVRLVILEQPMPDRRGKT